MKDFDPTIYRAFNLDLAHLSEAALCEHFSDHQHEPRIYRKVDGDVELLSMKWLRGRGIEIGAGKYPTPLFGNASLDLVDCDEGLTYGGASLKIKLSLDDVNFTKKLPEQYDFAIASHVLEHVDSFIRAVENLIKSIKKGGCVYLVLPDKDWLQDKTYIEKYDFAHHEQEYFSPLKFARAHDKKFIEAVKLSSLSSHIHVAHEVDFLEEFSSGIIEQEKRFIYHKHNYNFLGWVELLQKTSTFLDGSFEIVDLRFGNVRKDCHFILMRTND